MEDHTLPPCSARRSFSLVGFSFTVLIAVSLVAQLTLGLVPRWIGCEFLEQESWWIWVTAAAPMYLFAFPAAILMLRILPGQAPERQKLNIGQFLTLIPISFCLMYAGNMVGTLLSGFLSGGEAQNAIAEYAMDQSPLKILVMVILAPLFEELVYRKLLIDRTARYGEKISVLMSGLLFGLLHQNLFQFFYAFALGSLFAYVYVRTGRIRYTVILHALINFLGSVAAPAVVSMLSSDAMTSLMSELEAGKMTVETLTEAAPGMIFVLLYPTALLGVSIWGLVLLILKSRQLVWKQAELQLPRGQALKAALLNAGVIVYTVICLVMTVLALFYT